MRKIIIPALVIFGAIVIGSVLWDIAQQIDYVDEHHDPSQWFV